MTTKEKLLAKNRKAMFNHTLLEKYVAGIVLKGYEVKAIREGKVDFEGSYIKILNNEVVIINLNIGKYSKQSKEIDEVDSRKTRKLLLNRREIIELTREMSEKGRTAIPLALIIVNNLIKLEFAVVRGKKEFEKKQTAKDRQVQKDLAIETKEYRREDTF
jgi:SsrA-binding protein